MNCKNRPEGLILRPTLGTIGERIIRDASGLLADRDGSHRTPGAGNGKARGKKR